MVNGSVFFFLFRLSFELLVITLTIIMMMINNMHTSNIMIFKIITKKTNNIYHINHMILLIMFNQNHYTIYVSYH